MKILVRVKDCKLQTENIKASDETIQAPKVKTKVSDLDINKEELTTEQVNLFTKLLEESLDVFALSNPGTTTLISHSVDTGSNTVKCMLKRTLF